MLITYQFTKQAISFAQMPPHSDEDVFKLLLTLSMHEIAEHIRMQMLLYSNERKVNQRIKSDVYTNRFYEHIEDQKAAISEYLDKRFGRWR
jgi:hypothetical protein